MLASDVIKKISFVDPVTHDLVCRTMERAYGQDAFDDESHRIGGRMFAREFADVLHTELSWAEISKRVVHHVETHKQAKILRYPVHLLIVMYEEGLYTFHDKDALEVLLPNLKTFEGGRRVHTDLFNPSYRDLYGICFSYHLGIRYSYPILVGNPELRKLMFHFGNTARIGEFNYDVVVAFFANFEQSLPCDYSGPECISTEVIQAQAAYYRDLNIFWGHYLKRPKSMPSLLVLFYRWLYETYSDNRILSNQELLSEKLLYKCTFTEMVIGGSLDPILWRNRRKVHGAGSCHYNADQQVQIPIIALLDEYENSLPNIKQITRFNLIKPLFSNSLREEIYRVKALTDLNENTFFRQLEFFKSKYGYDPELLRETIEAVRRLYAHIIDHNPEWKIFENSRKVSKAVVKSRKFSQYYAEGYEFVTLSHFDFSRDVTKLIVSFLPGDQRHNSIVSSEAFYRVNSTPIPNRLYRSLFTRYIFSNSSIEIRQSDSVNIVEMLSFLFALKTLPGSPSPDQRHLSAFEADQIRAWMLSRDIADGGKGKILNAFKKFFIWAEDSGEFTLEPLTLVHFRSLPHRRDVSKIEAVPKEHIEKIANFFLDNKQKSFRYELSFVILNLILQTPFRAKDICRLERDCLIETGKKDVYVIRLKSKTSKDEYEDRTIPLATYRLVKQAIRRTEPLVKECSIEEYRKLIFLEQSPWLGGIIPFTPNNFHISLKRACKEMGLPEYKPSNLRKSYMTFAYIESSKRKNGDGDYFLKTNSYHKDKRTTLTHYVDRSKVLLNSSFGYSLGSEEELKAVETISVQNKNITVTMPERLTPDGIGFCGTKECIGMVTCLGCRHLILTDDSAPAIKHILEDLDNQIVRCEIDHERDGLIDIRAAYSRCLDIINKHIQESNESTSIQ